MGNKKTHRAGMILYHLSENSDAFKMLFQRPATPKFGGDTFQLCKGKIEKNESELEAAIREAQEEVGLFVPNINGDIYSLGIFLGRTTVFVAEVNDPFMFGDPDSEVAETQWMTPSEFHKEGRLLHRPIVEAATRWITYTIQHKE